MKFKISNILKCIIFLFFISLSLFAREKMKVATIDLDNHFKINKPLRREVVRTLNRYPYLKQKHTITVDRAKKKLFGTNELNIENGLIVASNLKIRIAILIESEKILITNENITNNQNNQNDNLGFSNNPKDYFNQISNNDRIINYIISNEAFTNNIPTNNILINDTNNSDNNLTDNINNDEEKKDLAELMAESIENNEDGKEEPEERYEFKYNFNVIDIESEDILKEYKSVSSNEAIYTLQSISDYLEFYFARMTFDSFEKRKNDINLNFFIEKISSDNQTNSIYDKGEIKEGEYINIKFSPNKEGYVYIFALQNNGNMILMYPNDFNNYINNDNIREYKAKANENYTIPPENSLFRIAMSPLSIDGGISKNIDSFYAVYTKRKQAWITGQYFSGDGFKTISRNRIAEFVFKLKSKLRYEWQISKIYLKAVSKIE